MLKKHKKIKKKNSYLNIVASEVEKRKKNYKLCWLKKIEKRKKRWEDIPERGG
jgi:hypothetical protein